MPSQIDIVPIDEPLVDPETGEMAESWRTWFSLLDTLMRGLTERWITANRPTAELYIGRRGFNTTLGRMEIWDGTSWVYHGGLWDEDESAYVADNPFIGMAPYLLAQDQKTSGTSAGTFTSGAWRTRVIAEIENNIVGASVASNQASLPAGTYWAEWLAPGYRCDGHQTRLQNITDATTIEAGISAIVDRQDSAPNIIVSQNSSHGSSKFTIAGTKTIELQHQCQTTANNGLGLALGFGTEIYATLKIWKIGT